MPGIEVLTSLKFLALSVIELRQIRQTSYMLGIEVLTSSNLQAPLRYKN